MMSMCFRLLDVQWDGKSFVYMKAYFQASAMSREDPFCSSTWHGPLFFLMNIQVMEGNESESTKKRFLGTTWHILKQTIQLNLLPLRTEQL